MRSCGRARKKQAKGRSHQSRLKTHAEKQWSTEMKEKGLQGTEEGTEEADEERGVWSDDGG